jgi:hypothetical protein
LWEGDLSRFFYFPTAYIDSLEGNLEPLCRTPIAGSEDTGKAVSVVEQLELAQQKFVQERVHLVLSLVTTSKTYIFMVVNITHKFKAATFCFFCQSWFSNTAIVAGSGIML